MIKKITIKNVATFNKNNGTEINDLKTVNFFFGYNGTGKSTIAKYLYNINIADAERSLDFIDCAQNGYDSTKHQILVFDEIFVENNFNKSDTLKGIFSLNQTNDRIDNLIKDEENIISEYEKYIKNKKSLIETLQTDIISKETQLKNNCFRERDNFISFTKIALEYSGSKANHFNKLKLIQQHQNIPTVESLSDVYQKLYEKDIVKIEKRINIPIYKSVRYIERDLCKLLSEVIVGNEDVNIAALIKTINSRSWVEQGVEFLNQTNKICPFCQQETIDEVLTDQFNKYFDITYKNKIARIKELKDLYNQACNRLIENMSDIQRTYNPESMVSNLLIDLRGTFDKNLRVIDDKLLKPNERKEIVSLAEIKNIISIIIKGIEKNNNDFERLDDKKKELIANIWKYMASKCDESIKNFSSRIIKCDRIKVLAADLINSKEKSVITSKQKINEWRLQTVNTKEAIDNINLILKTSGFEGFKIEEKVKVNNISQYYLKRNNATNSKPVFKSLSEGEKNFISFLYFYQLCIGTDDVNNNGSKKKIIVIDDPVSSLDSHVLFVISTLIHQLIWRKGDDKPNKKLLRNVAVEQVFILTHNLYFYKEVSFNKRPTCTDYRHYVISKTNNETKIIGEDNKTIFDDYSLLWNTIKVIKTKMPSDSVQNITISNLMRRIIDSYVSFIGLGKDSWGAILNEDIDNPQYLIKCAFISTINDESHKTAPFDSIYYQKIINEQPQMLFDVFESIFNTIGIDHYNMMLGIESDKESAS